MPTVAALLAAGGGSRFTGPTHKLLAPLHGRPVWQHALEHLLSAGFDRVVVVTGAVPLPLPPGVDERHNAQWQLGQAGSLRAALDYADEVGADSVTVGLADQPFVTSSSWTAVRDAPDHPIVVAEYDGAVGPHPIRLARSVWPLLPCEGDEGGRSLIRLHPEWVYHVPCLGSAADIDTPEDLERWKSC